MKHFSYLAVVCLLALSACTGSFKKGDDGMEYKLINNGSGKTMAYGNFMQLHIKQVYGGTKDTILGDSREFMPRIVVFDSINTPVAYFKIMKNMKKGDSLVIRTLTDSVFKAGREMPAFMKKGKYLYTHISLINFFETKDQADSAGKAEMALARPRIYKTQIAEVEKDLATKKDQLAADSKIIEDFLAKNNIKAQKTKWGTYIEIKTEGSGEQINNNHIATVNYTGRTLDSGRVFDSNIDPKFNHVQPFEVNLAELGSVIMGWTDGLMQLKKGTKATIYIPSSLAYGAQGNGNEIKANENLIFDIEVIDITSEEAYAAKQKAQQEEIMKKAQQGQNPNPAEKNPGNE